MTERTTWTDERVDDAFARVHAELADLRFEMRAGFERVHADIRQLWVTTIGGFVAIAVALAGVAAASLA